MRRAAASMIAAVALGLGLASAPGGTAAAGEPAFRLLVFSHTEGFRHFAIPIGHRTIAELGAAHGFEAVGTEDPREFTSSNLKRFDAVVFLLTTGDVLPARGQRALKRFMRAGGGYVGIHSASDTEHEWPFYKKLVGALFLSHPLINQTARFTNEAPHHPATDHFDPSFRILDEHYSFKTNPRPEVRVLLTIDESSFSTDPSTLILNGDPGSGAMGDDHPMSWCHDNAGGRSFYTALGHRPDNYDEPWFRRHIYGGILTATRQVKAGC